MFYLSSFQTIFVACYTCIHLYTVSFSFKRAIYFLFLFWSMLATFCFYSENRFICLVASRLLISCRWFGNFLCTMLIFSNDFGLFVAFLIPSIRYFHIGFISNSLANMLTGCFVLDTRLHIHMEYKSYTNNVLRPFASVSPSPSVCCIVFNADWLSLMFIARCSILLLIPDNFIAISLSRFELSLTYCALNECQQ